MRPNVIVRKVRRGSQPRFFIFPPPPARGPRGFGALNKTSSNTRVSEPLVVVRVHFRPTRLGMDLTGWMVRGVYRNSQASMAGVEPGWQIIAVEDTEAIDNHEAIGNFLRALIGRLKQQQDTTGQSAPSFTITFNAPHPSRAIDCSGHPLSHHTGHHHQRRLRQHRQHCHRAQQTEGKEEYVVKTGEEDEDDIPVIDESHGQRKELRLKQRRLKDEEGKAAEQGVEGNRAEGGSLHISKALQPPVKPSHHQRQKSQPSQSKLRATTHHHQRSKSHQQHITTLTTPPSQRRRRRSLVWSPTNESKHKTHLSPPPMFSPRRALLSPSMAAEDLILRASSIGTAATFDQDGEIDHRANVPDSLRKGGGGGDRNPFNDIEQSVRQIGGSGLPDEPNEVLAVFEIRLRFKVRAEADQVWGHLRGLHKVLKHLCGPGAPRPVLALLSDLNAITTASEANARTNSSVPPARRQEKGELLLTQQQQQQQQQAQTNGADNDSSSATAAFPSAATGDSLFPLLLNRDVIPNVDDGLDDNEEKKEKQGKANGKKKEEQEHETKQKHHSPLPKHRTPSTTTDTVDGKAEYLVVWDDDGILNPQLTRPGRVSGGVDGLKMTAIPQKEHAFGDHASPVSPLSSGRGGGASPQQHRPFSPHSLPEPPRLRPSWGFLAKGYVPFRVEVDDTARTLHYAVYHDEENSLAPGEQTDSRPARSGPRTQGRESISDKKYAEERGRVDGDNDRYYRHTHLDRHYYANFTRDLILRNEEEEEGEEDAEAAGDGFEKDRDDDDDDDGDEGYYDEETAMLVPVAHGAVDGTRGMLRVLDERSYRPYGGQEKSAQNGKAEDSPNRSKERQQPSQPSCYVEWVSTFVAPPAPPKEIIAHIHRLVHKRSRAGDDDNDDDEGGEEERNAAVRGEVIRLKGLGMGPMLQTIMQEASRLRIALSLDVADPLRLAVKRVHIAADQTGDRHLLVPSKQHQRLKAAAHVMESGAFDEERALPRLYLYPGGGFFKGPQIFGLEDAEEDASILQLQTNIHDYAGAIIMYQEMGMRAMQAVRMMKEHAEREGFLHSSPERMAECLPPSPLLAHDEASGEVESKRKAEDEAEDEAESRLDALRWFNVNSEHVLDFRVHLSLLSAGNDAPLPPRGGDVRQLPSSSTSAAARGSSAGLPSQLLLSPSGSVERHFQCGVANHRNRIRALVLGLRRNTTTLRAILEATNVAIFCFSKAGAVRQLREAQIIRAHVLFAKGRYAEGFGLFNLVAEAMAAQRWKRLELAIRLKANICLRGLIGADHVEDILKRQQPAGGKSTASTTTGFVASAQRRKSEVKPRHPFLGKANVRPLVIEEEVEKEKEGSEAKQKEAVGERDCQLRSLFSLYNRFGAYVQSLLCIITEPQFEAYHLCGREEIWKLMMCALRSRGRLFETKGGMFTVSMKSIFKIESITSGWSSSAQLANGFICVAVRSALPFPVELDGFEVVVQTLHTDKDILRNQLCSRPLRPGIPRPKISETLPSAMAGSSSGEGGGPLSQRVGAGLHQPYSSTAYLLQHTSRIVYKTIGKVEVGPKQGISYLLLVPSKGSATSAVETWSGIEDRCRSREALARRSPAFSQSLRREQRRARNRFRMLWSEAFPAHRRKRHEDESRSEPNLPCPSQQRHHHYHRRRHRDNQIAHLSMSGTHVRSRIIAAWATIGGCLELYDTTLSTFSSSSLSSLPTLMEFTSSSPPPSTVTALDPSHLHPRRSFVDIVISANIDRTGNNGSVGVASVTPSTGLVANCVALATITIKTSARGIAKGARLTIRTDTQHRKRIVDNVGKLLIDISKILEGTSASKLHFKVEDDEKECQAASAVVNEDLPCGSVLSVDLPVRYQINRFDLAGTSQPKGVKPVEKTFQAGLFAFLEYSPIRQETSIDSDIEPSIYKDEAESKLTSVGSSTLHFAAPVALRVKARKAKDGLCWLCIEGHSVKGISQFTTYTFEPPRNFKVVADVNNSESEKDSGVREGAVYGLTRRGFASVDAPFNWIFKLQRTPKVQDFDGTAYSGDGCFTVGLAIGVEVSIPISVVDIHRQFGVIRKEEGHKLEQEKDSITSVEILIAAAEWEVGQQEEVEIRVRRSRRTEAADGKKNENVQPTLWLSVGPEQSRTWIVTGRTQSMLCFNKNGMDPAEETATVTLKLLALQPGHVPLPRIQVEQSVHGYIGERLPIKCECIQWTPSARPRVWIRPRNQTKTLCLG